MVCFGVGLDQNLFFQNQNFLYLWRARRADHSAPYFDVCCRGVTIIFYGGGRSQLKKYVSILHKQTYTYTYINPYIYTYWYTYTFDTFNFILRVYGTLKAHALHVRMPTWPRRLLRVRLHTLSCTEISSYLPHTFSHSGARIGLYIYYCHIHTRMWKAR